MKRKLFTVLFALVAALCLCFGLVACGGGGENEPEAEKGADGHTHTAEHFQVDENGHWKICTECGEKFSVGNHGYNSDNACKTCGYSEVYTKGLEYQLDEDTDTYTVTGLGEATDTIDLIIPAYYEGKAVTEIGDGAFWDCSGLMRVTIGNNVTSIGFMAFEDCSRLTSITIPDSVTSIGGLAFKGTAHYNDAANWDSAGVLYIGNHLIEAKRDIISGSYTVKQGTKTIAGYAFAGGEESDSLLHLEGCLNLTSIVIPDSVTSIGKSAFYYCRGLKSVTIPDSVACIGNEAFHECSGLESMTIGSGVTSIGGWAFYYCTGLTGELKIPDSVTSIGDGAFRDCRGLESVTIGSGVTSIGSEALGGCSSLEHITVAQGNDAYRSEQDCLIETKSNTLVLGCKNSVIPNGVTSIGDYAFYYCSGLTNIVIPDSVNSIEKGAFWLCTGLTSIEIPGSVTSIGDHAFYSSGLTSVTMSDSVTEIGESAFSGCGLTEIYFDGTIEKWKEIKGPRPASMSDKTVVHCTNGDCDLWGYLIQS